MQFFGRYYKLQIGERVFETSSPSQLDLDIKFDIAFSPGQKCRQGIISILGLSYDTMSPFLELSGLERGKAVNKMLKVKLEVGYFTTPKRKIFEGWAYYGSITKPPEMWLILKVAEYPPHGGIITDYSILERDAKISKIDLANAVMNEYGYRVIDKTTSQLGNDRIKSFSMNKKTAIEAIQELNKLADWSLFMGSKSEPIIAYDNNPLCVIDSVIYVDKEYGLLSVDGITNVNAQLTCFFRGDIPRNPINFIILLDSIVSPYASGTYRLLKVHDRGHYNGNEWYTTFYCTNRI